MNIWMVTSLLKDEKDENECTEIDLVICVSRFAKFMLEQYEKCEKYAFSV